MLELDKIYNMDCLEGMKQLDDNCIDTIITDPPYGLSFMGKKWDYDVPSIAIWKECLRVLKPGGTLLCFAGSRTQHRMAVNVEDAGFILKDCIMWLYGSGFPKASDISKQLDKRKKGNERLKEFSAFIKHKRIELGISKSEADKYICDGSTMYSFFEGRNNKPLYFPNNNHYKKMKELFELDNTWDDFVLETNEKIIATKDGSFGYQKDIERWKKEQKITEPNTEEAKLWDGWKSHGLKPAYEPILVAMKPNDGSYANNALVWGVSGLNIDGGRIGYQNEKDENSAKVGFKGTVYKKYMEGQGRDLSKENPTQQKAEMNNKGRYPANILFSCDCDYILKSNVSEENKKKLMEWLDENT